MKKIEFYIVRHGETVWNQKKLLQGTQDIPLSEKGIEEAYEMSAKLKKLNLGIIGVSPLARTQETASIISRELGISIKTIEELKARNYGPWEGKSPDSIRAEHKELFKSLCNYTKEEAFVKPPLESIESYKSVSDRALRSLHQFDCSALLVTHSGVMTSILLALKFNHPEIPLFEQSGLIKLKLESKTLTIEDVQGLSEVGKIIKKDSNEPSFIF